VSRWIFVALLLLGCEGPASPPVTFTAPPRETFAPVGEMIHAHCGSLDCHGQIGRNLRIYGKDGFRLSPNDVPGLDGGVTTQPELDANYAAVVGLEPEILARVFREGSDPEQLTLVRKARGVEAHKGGVAVVPGSAADDCLVGWLRTGAADVARCQAAASVPQPPGF
jgi:hypothetical protein